MIFACQQLFWNFLAIFQISSIKLSDRTAANWYVWSYKSLSRWQLSYNITRFSFCQQLFLIFLYSRIFENYTFIMSRAKGHVQARRLPAFTSIAKWSVIAGFHNNPSSDCCMILILCSNRIFVLFRPAFIYFYHDLCYNGSYVIMLWSVFLWTRKNQSKWEKLLLYRAQGAVGKSREKRQRKMNITYFIGNGFDVGLHLDTTYKNFTHTFWKTQVLTINCEKRSTMILTLKTGLISKKH